MSDITGNQTVRIRMPVATAAEIDTAKKKGVFAFDTTAGTAAVCPADGANFVRLGLHPADAPAATSLGGTDLVLIVQGGVLKRTTVADLSGGGVWQPLDSDLTAIAALTTTSFGRSLLAMVDGPAVRAAIGAGTVVPGDLASYQPLDSDLTAIASLTTDAFGRGLLPLASAAAVRSYIGAGTSSFSGAYASLSSIPASIDAIDGLTPAADRIPYYTGASTGALATLTAFARTLLDDQDAAAFRGTIGALPADSPDFSGSLKQGGVTRIASGGGAWLTSMQSANLVGAGDRPVAADLTGTLQPKTPDQFRNMIFALASSLKGAANGVAELGGDVKVPVAQLPSAALLALGADSTTAHRGDHGTTAYTHSQIATGNPHGTTAADVGAAKAPSKRDVSASTTIGSIDATAIKVTTTDVNLTLSGGVDGQGWDIVCPTTSFGISIPTGVTLYAYAGSDIGPTARAVGGGRGIRIVRIDAATWIAPNLTW